MSETGISKSTATEYSLINLMKFISAILVVIIHVNPFNGIYGYVVGNIIARIAVPFFFITTGFFVYEKLKKDGMYLKKYLYKLIILYSIWYGVYLIIRLFVEFDGFNIKQIILLVREYLFSGFFQLWYLPSLIISVYFISKFVKYKKENWLIVISIILFVIGLLGDSYGGLLHNVVIEGTINIYTLVFGKTSIGLCFAVPFLTIGILIKRYEIYDKLKSGLINKILLISSILFIVESLTLQHYEIGYGRNMYIMLIFVVPVIFIKLLNSKITLNKNISDILRDLSMNIYFCHAIFIIAWNYLELKSLFSIQYQNVMTFLFVIINSVALSLIIILVKKRRNKNVCQNRINIELKN